MSSKLLDIKKLESCIGVPARTIRTLYQQRKIPYYKMGHRTVLFDPEKVIDALYHFEVKERDIHETSNP